MISSFLRRRTHLHSCLNIHRSIVEFIVSASHCMQISKCCEPFFLLLVSVCLHRREKNAEPFRLNQSNEIDQINNLRILFKCIRAVWLENIGIFLTDRFQGKSEHHVSIKKTKSQERGDYNASRCCICHCWLHQINFRQHTLGGKSYIFRHLFL